MSKKRVEYSDTFKAEAIAKIKENNGNISQTAKELGIPMKGSFAGGGGILR